MNLLPIARWPDGTYLARPTTLTSHVLLAGAFDPKHDELGWFTGWATWYLFDPNNSLLGAIWFPLWSRGTRSKIVNVAWAKEIESSKKATEQVLPQHFLWVYWEIIKKLEGYHLAPWTNEIRLPATPGTKVSHPIDEPHQLLGLPPPTLALDQRDFIAIMAAEGS